MPNETNPDKRIEDLISIMDEENLANAIRIMGKVTDAEKIIEALESAMSEIDVDFDSVKEDALFLLEISEENFFLELNSGNDYDDPYCDNGEIATDLVTDSIEQFKDDVKKLMILNRIEDANTVVRAVAAALRESKSLMVKLAADFPEELADNLEKCMREGNPLDGFEW
ncbi:MAG: hypothetical protein ACOX1N_01160 [Candidatus Methanomethylophilaceae archaeon]|jgi:protein-tyrosine-phosphatase